MSNLFYAGAAAGGVILVSVGLGVTSPDSDFIIGRDFERRQDFGYINYQESLLFNSVHDYEDHQCSGNIYVNKTPNHIATLTNSFTDNSIQVKVEANSGNADLVILIQSPDKSIDICHDEDKTGSGEEVFSFDEKVLFSYDYGDEVPAGVYRVWIGDKKRSNSTGSLEYTIDIVKDYSF